MISENLNTQKVYGTTQGTNQMDMSVFDNMSQKVWALLEDSDAHLSPGIVKLIKSTKCPHLNELLNIRLKKDQ